MPDDLKLAALGIAAGYYNWAADGNKEVVRSQRRQLPAGVRQRAEQRRQTTADRNFAVVDSYKVRRV